MVPRRELQEAELKVTVSGMMVSLQQVPDAVTQGNGTHATDTSVLPP